MPSRRGVIAAAMTLPLHRAGAQSPAEFIGIEGWLNTTTPLYLAGLRRRFSCLHAGGSSLR